MSSRQLLIVHLTDLHVKNSSSPSLSSLQLVPGAVRSILNGAADVVVCVSGDIAYSGKESEYQLALKAYANIHPQLTSIPNVTVRLLCSPGNHDCDFSSHPPIDIREALIKEFPADPKDPRAFVEQLSQSQRAYDSFADEACSDYQKISPLLRTTVINSGDRLISFLGINTSWSSRIKEDPGKLRMAVSLLDAPETDSDYAIAIAHHPLNWYHPNDAIAFSSWLDQHADLVLWGHEHRFDEFKQSRQRLGSSVEHQIGLPIDNEGKCGFIVLDLRISDQYYTRYEFEFHKGMAQLAHKQRVDFEANGARIKNGVHYSNKFRKFLSDPGAGFTHPRVNRALTLDDLFVAPDFREIRSDRVRSDKIEGNIGIEELCSKIQTTPGTYVVYGSEQSGKSTFAKHLLTIAASRRRTAVYLDCTKLQSSNNGEIRSWFSRAIEQQFDERSARLVDQSARSDLIAVVDNLHGVPGEIEGANKLFAFLTQRSSNILLLTSDNPAISIVADACGGEHPTYWKDAKAYELMPLGHRRRGQLIRRWVSLGRDSTDDSEKIEAEVRQVKHLLDRMLGRSTFPKYPLFMLALIQQLEGQRQNQTIVTNGSHGYLFEALVSQAIDRFVRTHEISTVNDFLATMAYHTYKRDNAGLTEIAVSEIANEFRTNLVEINHNKLLKELVEAHVLSNEGGFIRFRYQYLLYYYLAKWICASQNTHLAAELLDELIEILHTERSTNVLMFVAYFKHEQSVLSRLLPLIDSLFIGERIGRLVDYSGLLVRFRDLRQRAILLQGRACDVSDAHNTDMDNAETERQCEDISDTLRINTTSKALFLLGQILRSRATAIGAEQKRQIAAAAIGVSRRLMAFMYRLTSEHADVIVRAVSTAFEEAFRLNREDAIKSANSLIAQIVVAIARWSVGRAAETISAPELRPLVDAIDQQNNDQDVGLILLGARVIGEKAYPIEAIEDHVKSLQSANVLPVSVLAGFSVRRFYLSPPERSVMNSACRLLGIDIKQLRPPSTLPRRSSSR